MNYEKDNKFGIKKITAFETKLKSKILKEISKLHYCLKRILLNTKTINNSDDLSYTIYFTLKEVFEDIKVINISKDNNINYYGYGFSTDLIDGINKIDITNKYAKEIISSYMVYFAKYNDNSISFILIDKNELDEKKDIQILTTLKHISNLADFNNTTIAA